MTRRQGYLLLITQEIYSLENSCLLSITSKNTKNLFYLKIISKLQTKRSRMNNDSHENYCNCSHRGYSDDGISL